MADDTIGNATVDGAQTANDSTTQGATEKSVPYSRFQEVLSQRKAAETALESIVEELAQDVPEDMRDLIPAGLPAVEKAAWIRNAKAKGLFTKAGAGEPDSPGSKRPGAKPPQDLSGLNPVQQMSMGYGR